MTRVFVTTTAVETLNEPWALSNYRRVMLAAEKDRVGRHSLVNHAANADLILFVDSSSQYHLDVLSCSPFERWPERCVVFDCRDNTIPLIPGIYMSIPEWLGSAEIYQYGFYIRVFENQVLRERAPHSRCRYLFSFVGAVENAPELRGAVLRLPGERAVIRNVSSGQQDGDLSYAKVLEESKFVLCPRGLGPSTWRVFEAMRTGRSPVVISDEWRPPPGLRWDEFAVMVREDDVDQIPERLASLEHVAEHMGRLAWEEWERNFSLTTSFNWLVSTAEKIQSVRADCDWLTRRIRLWEALRSSRHRGPFFREWLGAALSW